MFGSEQCCSGYDGSENEAKHISIVQWAGWTWVGGEARLPVTNDCRSLASVDEVAILQVVCVMQGIAATQLGISDSCYAFRASEKQTRECEACTNRCLWWVNAACATGGGY
jgi:hypothetical protein